MAAVVNEISQTILTRSDAAGPIELKEPAYRVTVALDRPDIDAYGKRIPLQAGYAPQRRYHSREALGYEVAPQPAA